MKVESKFGSRSYFFLFTCIMAFPIAFYLFRVAQDGTARSVTGAYFAGVLVYVAAIIVFIGILRVKVEVTKDGFISRGLFKTQRIRFDSIVKIIAEPDSFGAFSLRIVFADGRQTRIYDPIIGNHHEINRAILDAVKLINPEVQLDSWFTDIYGEGPYGYFGMEKRGRKTPK